jgi:hypothetical protein
MSRFSIAVALWTLVLVGGFAVIFALGEPLPTEAEQLEAAFHPSPPVSQAAAIQLGETIVRLQHQEFLGSTAKVTLLSELGIERWLVSYTDPASEAAKGLRISVTVQSGVVEVTAYP